MKVKTTFFGDDLPSVVIAFDYGGNFDSRIHTHVATLSNVSKDDYGSNVIGKWIIKYKNQ